MIRNDTATRYTQLRMRNLICMDYTNSVALYASNFITTPSKSQKNFNACEQIGAPYIVYGAWLVVFGCGTKIASL